MDENTKLEFIEGEEIFEIVDDACEVKVGPDFVHCDGESNSQSDSEFVEQGESLIFSTTIIF